jgi:thiamine biosynthesis protein ThiS
LNLIRLIPAKGGTKNSDYVFCGLCVSAGVFLWTNSVKTELKMAARLVINGTEKTYEPDDRPATLADLLVRMKIDQATVVAEIDGAIVPRDAFAQTHLADGMTLELVRFVAGG